MISGEDKEPHKVMRPYVIRVWETSSRIRKQSRVGKTLQT